MTTVKWQSNDPLSTVTLDKSRGVDTQPKVRTGYINLEVPASTHFEFLEQLGTSLQSQFRILSPTEALRIKYNLNAQDMTTERMVNGVSLWKIVFERYHDPSFQTSFERRFPDFGWGSTWQGSRGELNSFRNMALQDVEDCENLISRFLGSTLRAKLMERSGIYPYSSALEVTNRIGQTQDDPNVYSQDGLGRGAPSPALDFISSAFCRVIQNPNEDQPNADVGAVGTKALNYIFDMERQGLTPFYPLLNPRTTKTYYGEGPDVVAEVLSTLGEARRIAGQNQDIWRSFGTGNTLKAVFDTYPSPYVKLAIASTLYPWVYDETAPFGTFSKKQSTSFVIRLMGRDRVVKSAPLVHTLVLMDYLNRDQALMQHTVGYLAWIKSKCERALAVQGSASFASALKRSDVASNLFKQQVQMPAVISRGTPALRSRFTTAPLTRTSTSVIPPGTTFTGGSTPIQLPTGFGSGGSFPQFGTSPSDSSTRHSDEVRTETGELVINKDVESTVGGETEVPENMEIKLDKGGELIAEQRRLQELKRREDLALTQAADDSKKRKYIYIGSAVAVVSAIGALIYVKRKK